MTEIKKISDLQMSEMLEIENDIRFIFYQSSSVKVFRDEDHKKYFYEIWCGDYVKNYADNFYLLFHEGKLLGYLSGSLDTAASLSKLRVPGLSIFQNLFNEYPAHLHINFHPDARNRGLGSHLVNFFFNECKKEGINGVHLITSPDSKNVSFYRRLGFDHEEKREFNNSTLLFMGKYLTG